MIDNPTKSAKNELTKVDEQIDNINNKYSKDAIQEPSPEKIPLPQQPQDSGAVREGDTEGTEIYREVTPETKSKKPVNQPKRSKLRLRFQRPR